MRLQLRETDLPNLENKKKDRPLPRQIRRQPKTANPNHLTKKMKVPLIMGAKWKKCTNPSCNYRHPPVCQNYISETVCRSGRSCAISDMLSWRRSPTRSRRRCERISCCVEGIGTHELRIAGSSSKEVYSTERRTSRNQLQGSIPTMHLAPHENSGKKGSVVRYYSGEPHERSSCAPKFVERSLQDTLQQERCARRVAWNLAENLYKLQKLDEATLLLSYWSKGNAGAHFKIARGSRIRGWFRSFNAHAEQKGFELRWKGHFEKVQTPNSFHDGQWWSANIRGGTKNVHDLGYSWQGNYSMRRQLFYRSENSAKTTDIPMSGSASKSHGWPKKGGQLNAKLRTTYLL